MQETAQVPEVFEALALKAQTKLEELNAQDLSNILWANATTGAQVTDVFKPEDIEHIRNALRGIPKRQNRPKLKQQLTVMTSCVPGSAAATGDTGSQCQIDGDGSTDDENCDADEICYKVVIEKTFISVRSASAGSEGSRQIARSAPGAAWHCPEPRNPRGSCSSRRT